jgi:hypothetical protein
MPLKPEYMPFSSFPPLFYTHIDFLMNLYHEFFEKALPDLE